MVTGKELNCVATLVYPLTLRGATTFAIVTLMLFVLLARTIFVGVGAPSHITGELFVIAYDGCG
jgi:hypothetical protein